MDELEATCELALVSRSTVRAARVGGNSRLRVTGVPSTA